MRARTLFATLLVLCLLPAGTAAAASSKFTIRGAGFGHGVGMSQYGAYGFALNGAGYRDILGHYYTGTAIGSLDPNQRVRVLLQSVRGSASFTGAVRAGRRRLSARKTYYVRRYGGRVQLRSSRGKRMGTYSALRVTGRGGMVTLRGRAANGRVSGAYRGAIDFSPGAFSGVDAINALTLDTYLQGVVPDESPPSWPLEALKAQAVAARTYAVATMKPGAGFDLYPDTRSQVYGGVAAEEASTNQAIAETRGEVVTYDGVPVVTYFFSTSGGRTEDVENTPLGNEPRPWLKSVDDPYDDESPRHRWGPIRMTLKQAGRKLGGLVKGKFRGIEVVQRGRSPRIVEADVIGSRGTHPHHGGRCARGSGCSTRGRSSPRSPPARSPLPSRRTGPPTGGAEPFGSAAWLKAHPVGALARAGAAGPEERQGARAAARRRPVGHRRRGARAARRALPVHRDRAREPTGSGTTTRTAPPSASPDPLGHLRLRRGPGRLRGDLQPRARRTADRDRHADDAGGVGRDVHGALVEDRDRLRRRARRAARGVPPALPRRGCSRRSRPSCGRCRASLAALDAITLPNCVASSASIEKMRFTLGHTGLWDRFEGRIFSATMVEHGKPAPDLFLHAAATMGWEPGRVRRRRGLARGRRGGRGRRDDRVRLRGLDAGRTARRRRPRVHRHGRAAGPASAFVERARATRRRRRASRRPRARRSARA